jgi:hypothetical protein
MHRGSFLGAEGRVDEDEIARGMESIPCNVRSKDEFPFLYEAGQKDWHLAELELCGP